jgi:hypothetical protein
MAIKRRLKRRRFFIALLFGFGFGRFPRPRSDASPHRQLMICKARFGLRKLCFIAMGLASIIYIHNLHAENTDNFETLMSGHGDITSYIYSKQDANYFIDTELSVSLETFRYRRFFFLVDLSHEIYLGRKYHSNMVFDPNRGGWAFGLAGRFEFEKYFLDLQMHHDCFHDVGRWEQVDFSVFWNSPRVGFGSKGYLTKYRFHQPISDQAGLVFPRKIDYYIQASFFAPKGNAWQKNHDYEFTMLTNFNILAARYYNLGFTIESNNLWVLNTNHKLKRRHALNFDFVVYGKQGVFMAYLGWWPYDSQSIRNRNGMTSLGIHLGF